MDFNSRAKKWDNEKRIKRAKVIAEEIKKSIEIKKNYKALELGCGTGLVSFVLRDEFSQLTLIDTSQGMVDVANEKIKNLNQKNMKAYCKDLLTENTEDKKYDVIYSAMALHHIENIEEILKKQYEILEDNGYICIAELNEDDGSFHNMEQGFKGHNGFNQIELADKLKRIGFSETSSRIIYRDVKIDGDKKIPFSIFLMNAKKHST